MSVDWSSSPDAARRQPYGSSLGSATLLVYLIRHGQSYNTHPSPDEPTPVNPPLTPIGEAQARLVARRLRPLGVDRLVASPMIRAIDTARAIAAELDRPVEVWARCHEYRATPGYRCWGAAGLRSRYPDLVLPADLGEDEWEYGDETFEMASRRAVEFLRWLEAQAPRSNAARIAVVTHGAFTRVVLGEILGLAPAAIERLTIDNTAVTTLALSREGFSVLGLNDTSHLAGVDGLDPLLGVTR